MILAREQAMQFIEGYKAALLRVLANAETPRSGQIMIDLTAARSLVKADRILLDTALAELADEGDHIPASIAAAIRSLRIEMWIYLRQNKTFAVFLDAKAENAYAVQALTTPLDELVGEPPFIFEAALIEFNGKFVCDGLVLDPVAIGPNHGSELKAAYARLRQVGKFHTRAAA